MKEITDSHQVVQNAREELMLLYNDGSLSSYTENIMRGDGVVSLNINPGNTITVFTEDDAVYGEIHYNKDLSFTIKMPKDIVARKVVPNSDFISFEFDAENPGVNPGFIFIYLNKTMMKVKKEILDYSYLPWDEYIKAQVISLKPTNKLHLNKDGQEVLLDDNHERVFKIDEIKKDIMHLASTVSGCCGHSGEKIEGRVRWRYEDVLLVNFTLD